jgi:hypothetical protein
MARTFALTGALVVIAGLAFLTVRVAIRDGFDIVVGISIIVIALMATGVIGALGAPPDD